MIPILYYNNTPIADMDSNGIGFLADCISCVCTEERNGIYEIEFQYPVTGKYFNQLVLGRIVSCVPSQGKQRQPFIIYRRSANIENIVTFNAYHYSYLLTYSIMPRSIISGIVNTFTAFESPIYKVADFTFSTDKTTSGTFTIDGFKTIKSMLCGSQGSVLDVFGGGEYDYDINAVTLYQNRGEDNGVVIRYGKNMLSLEDEMDGSNLYDGVIAFWVDSNTGTVTHDSPVYADETIYWTEEGNPPSLPENITDENNVSIAFKTALGRVYPLDVTDEFDTAPNASQLQAKSEAWLNNNTPWIPKRNIKVDFVDLSQTSEYKNIAPLETVKLCDTVKVLYEELGVVATAKVIKTEWNVLLDRYDNIEIGQVMDDYRGYNGKIKIGSKVYNIVNGLITSIL